MVQKPRLNKMAAKPIQPFKNKKAVKKHPPADRLKGNKENIANAVKAQKANNKAINEAYDRGFNDGYAKGIEDNGIDEGKESD